jgi:hypothetical protein
MTTTELHIDRFTKKPVTIEAVQLTDEADWDAIAAWCGGRIHQTQDPSDEYVTSLTIPTLEGTMWASENDWVIRGVKGEFYPCKPDIFEATYEKEED